MSKVFVIGDIHGAYRALRQCLDRSKFDYANDKLIFLGDVADGWPETHRALGELLKVRNLIFILGNHDWWTLEWMRTGNVDDLWYQQGGKATIDSYADGVPPAHITVLSQARLYYTLENRLFVHAGINPLVPVEEQGQNTFLWDRTLAALALELRGSRAEGTISKYDEIYLGHTPIPDSRPVCSMGVWLMDTGAGWSGVLSMMDVNTKEVFISDPVPSLYPGITGRQRRKV